MPLQAIGSQWLKEHYRLTNYSLTHSSYIGNKESIELTSKGHVGQVYGPKYNINSNNPLHHLEFSLKYDDLNLDFLKAVFEKISEQDIETFISSAHGSKYARKIGFLYEFLTGKQINLSKPVSGNYADLLEEDDYITGHTIKNKRWRINNNLLGVPEFCPLVRKTKALQELLSKDIQEEIQNLKQSYSQEIFRRAINYLYKKETKSSFEIEKEKPSPDRMERFIALLSKAGSETTEEMLSKQRLIQLQSAIVDPRFTAKDFREVQIYVGESLPNSEEIIHYICPPPALVNSLMKGLYDTAIKTQGIYPGLRAALIPFGFVFIHPFEDGNGRLHRFLIHDILVHDKTVAQGMIIPVSAHILNHLKEYDTILEKYSKPLMQKIKYNKQNNEDIMVTNTAEVEGYFRYPDLTDHSIYLIQTIHATIAEDMPGELLFIQRYDEAKRELQNIVDMPDKMINSMLVFLHQNQGIFPKRRREYFSKLTDAEIVRMQTAYRKVFELVM
ncbi:MAG: Fic family protein [Chitinophagaceae bacterium]